MVKTYFFKEKDSVVCVCECIIQVALMPTVGLPVPVYMPQLIAQLIMAA